MSLDGTGPKLLSPQLGGSLWTLRSILGVPDRASIPAFINRISPSGAIVVPLRAVHKFLNRIGIGENSEWIGFSDAPPEGYSQQEWRSKWPDPTSPSVNHSWGEEELLDRLGDKFGFAKEVPSPRSYVCRTPASSGRKRAHPDSDEVSAISTISVAKRRALEAVNNATEEELVRMAEDHEQRRQSL